MASEFVVLLRSIDQKNTEKHVFGQKDLSRELQWD